MNKRNKEELPLVDIKLTAKELNLLANEPSELMKLYIFLSTRRDFKTNIAGQETRINDAAFKESLDYSSKSGRQGWKPSTTHIKRWLSQLESLGLINVLGNNVFELPFAEPLESVKNLSHQGVTKGVTNFVTDYQPLKNLNNSNSYYKNNNEVSLEVSPQVERRLHLPHNNLTILNYTKLAPARFKNFIDLLKSRGFHENQIANKRVIAMLAAWHQAGITVEEAEIGMNHCDRGKTERPHPTYYESAVLEYKRDLHKATQKIENPPKADEVKHEQRRSQKPVSVDEKRAEAHRKFAEWKAAKQRELEEEGERDDDG